MKDFSSGDISCVEQLVHGEARMPVFDEVAKVIVIPAEAAGEGCLPTLGSIFGFVILMALISMGIDSCSGKKTPTVQNPSTAPQSRPAPQPRTPQQVRVTRFAALGPRAYPEVRPPLVAYLPEFSVVQWRGMNVRIPHKPSIPYAYLCTVNGGLNWCWPRAPSNTARPCSNNLSVQGWCWEETEWR